MKKTLLIDIDGVVADLTGHILNKINQKHDTNYNNSHIVSWAFHSKHSSIFKDEEHRLMANELFESSGLVADLPFIDGALNALNALQKTNRYKMVWATAPYEKAPSWVFDRMNWFQKHLFQISPYYVFAQNKELIDGDILIDDKPENILSFVNEKPDIREGLLFTQPWNKDTTEQHWKYNRVKSWDEILKELL